MIPDRTAAQGRMDNHAPAPGSRVLRLAMAIGIGLAVALVGSGGVAATMGPNASGQSGNATHPATQPLANPTYAHTYLVYKTADDAGIANCGVVTPPECSLRSAITTANTDGHGATPDLIFVFSGNLYQVGSSLPTLGGSITIANSTDQSCPGGIANVPAVLGTGLAADSDLLTLSDHDVLSGVLIQSATRDGIVITGSDNQLTCSISEQNTRHGVHIGPGAHDNQVGVAGNGGTIGNVDFVAASNGGDGILIDGVGATGNVVKNTAVGYVPPNVSGPNDQGIVITGGATGNRIGSDTQPQNYVNLIRNNTHDGIIITSSGTNGNIVTGNYIGTDATGNGAAGNGAFAISIIGPANRNRIGGDRLQGFGNLIAGNAGDGIALYGNPAPSGTTVQGNIIGLRRDFGGTLPNTDDGISLNSSMTLIGGEEDITTPTSGVHLGNVIGGNSLDGIELYADTQTSIYGNFIGTDPTATQGGLGNGRNGIRIEAGSTANQVGGAGMGQTNYIAGNGYSGIAIRGTGSDKNQVQGNVIGVKGDGSGVLPNGTSTGTRTGATVCTTGSGSGGTPDIQSEDCNAVFITANGAATGPTGNLIGGDRRAGQGNLLATDGRQLASGVLLDNASGNTIQGNSIGARSTGMTSKAYLTAAGIFLINGASNNQIGGDRALGQGNLVGSANAGVVINNIVFGGGSSTPSTASGNHIQGNAVGVDFGGHPDPNLAITNAGIMLRSDAGLLTNNLVGVDFGVANPNPALGNLVGNVAGGYGIRIGTPGGSGASGNQINGNNVGVTADGSSALAGCLFGIYITGGADSTTIQGNVVGAANLTGTSYGIVLQGPLIGASVTRNSIGTNAAGADLHTGIGLLLDGGADNNTVSQNVIGRNTVEGIRIGDNTMDSTTNQNRISQNRLFGNGGAGINLNYAQANPQGVVGGSDTGPNNQAHLPSITAATYDGGSTTLMASGTANPQSTVELFLATAPNATVPQGTFYVGAVAADLSGAWSFSGPLKASDATTYGLKLVATSTLNTPSQRQNSTSQFSDAFAATYVAPPPTNTATAGPTATNTSTASATGTGTTMAIATMTSTASGSATATGTTMAIATPTSTASGSATATGTTMAIATPTRTAVASVTPGGSAWWVLLPLIVR